jgi:hypothetical protein
LLGVKSAGAGESGGLSWSDLEESIPARKAVLAATPTSRLDGDRLVHLAAGRDACGDVAGIASAVSASKSANDQFGAVGPACWTPSRQGGW